MCRTRRHDFNRSTDAERERAPQGTCQWSRDDVQARAKRSGRGRLDQGERQSFGVRFSGERTQDDSLRARRNGLERHAGRITSDSRDRRRPDSVPSVPQKFRWTTTSPVTTNTERKPLRSTRHIPAERLPPSTTRPTGSRRTLSGHEDLSPSPDATEPIPPPYRATSICPDTNLAR